MRLVVVESRFAPRTPPSTAFHTHLRPPRAGVKDWEHCDACRIERIRKAEVAQHIAYARLAMADCLRRGEAPYASHLLYTQEGVLDDDKPAERELGIKAGYAWGEVAEAHIFYVDLGWSKGMLEAVQMCKVEDRAFDIRTIAVLGPLPLLELK